jgi:hypothetical protein
MFAPILKSSTSPGGIALFQFLTNAPMGSCSL